MSIAPIHHRRVKPPDPIKQAKNDLMQRNDQQPDKKEKKKEKPPYDSGHKVDYYA